MNITHRQKMNFFIIGRIEVNKTNILQLLSINTVFQRNNGAVLYRFEMAVITLITKNKLIRSHTSGFQYSLYLFHTSISVD